MIVLRVMIVTVDSFSVAMLVRVLDRVDGGVRKNRP